LFTGRSDLPPPLLQALNPKSPLLLQSDSGAAATALSDLDLEGQPDGSILPSFSDDGTAAGLNYDHGEAGTSFSSDRAEKASDAEWSSLQNPVYEGKSRVLKVASNILERDSPLDFSVSSRDNNSAPAKSKAVVAAVTFTPLGDIPAAPAVPTNVAEAFAAAQFQKARHLYSVGMAVDPQHGPLYHAYGNMELVNIITSLDFTSFCTRYFLRGILTLKRITYNGQYPL
jgi:hypothetical protein